MSRHNDRKLGLTLETLEGRELQSGVVSGSNAALLPAVTPNPALIFQNTPQIDANNSAHAYHGVAGFFGQ